MKRKQDNRNLQERACDLEKVVTFSIMTTIKKFYGTAEKFKQIFKSIVNGTCDSKVQVEFCSRFKCLTIPEYRKILGQIEKSGKRHWVSINDVKPYFSKWFHYQRHFNKRYKSGKTFVVHGYWYIDFDVVERWMNFDDVFNTKSSFYSKLQHIFIDSIILKGKTMTKKEKEQYKKDLEDGKKSIPLEKIIKDEQKKQQTLNKRRMTIAKKAAKEIFVEFTALQTKTNILEATNKEKDDEIKILRQQNEELRNLLKKNSDSLTQNINANSVVSEIPSAWTSYEGHYDFEGPNVEKCRSDGTPLEPKCCPSRWMENSDLFDFRDGKMDEDEFERLWQIYVMTDAEKNACRKSEESKAVVSSTPYWDEQTFDDQIKRCSALVASGDLDDIDDNEDHNFKVPRRLQEFIDKLYISLNDAKRIAKMYKEEILLKEAKYGFSVDDRNRNMYARNKIVSKIKDELKHYIDYEDLKYLNRMVV